VVRYFAAKSAPLEIAYGTVTSWANIISLFTWIFAVVVLILSHVMRVTRARVERRARLESICIMIGLVFFLLLGLSDPKLEQSTTFTLLYMGILGNIFTAIAATVITHWNYHIYRRIISFSFEPEFIAFLLIYVFTYFREMTLFGALVPITIPIGDWIEKVPYMAANRGLTIATAIGTFIVAIRALVAREPGMIEMEMA